LREPVRSAHRLGDSLGRRSETAHRRECRARNDAADDRREENGSERNEDEDQLEPPQRLLGLLEITHDENGTGEVPGLRDDRRDVLAEVVGDAVPRDRDVAVEVRALAGGHVAHRLVERQPSLDVVRNDAPMGLMISTPNPPKYSFWRFSGLTVCASVLSAVSTWA
jgi:hypothetical protein